MKVRLLLREFLDDPRRSLATEEAIFRLVSEGRSPPTLWLWRHSGAVILGRFQVPEEELNMDYVKEHGLIIAKRLTGGGAIYQDLGNIIYSIIMKDSLGIGLDFVRMYRIFIGAFLNSLKKKGVIAESPALNDVTVNGKKVMGTAATISKSTILFHATMLVKSDLRALASALKVPREKLQDKGVENVMHRVTNLYDETGMGILEATYAVIDGYSQQLGFEYYRDELTEEEKELSNKLYNEKYNTKEWIFERQI